MRMTNAVSRKSVMNKYKCLVLAFSLALSMVFTIPVSAAENGTNGGNFTVGGASGSWYIRCDNTGGRAEISVGSSNAGVSVTLTYAYFYRSADGSITPSQYGPGNASGNGYACKEYTKPSGAYSMQSSAYYSAQYNGYTLNIPTKTITP